MAFLLNDNFKLLINQLVQKISGFKESSKECKLLTKTALHIIKTSDTICYINRKDIDTSIQSFSDKFALHGYWNYSQQLMKSYEKYMNLVSHKDDASVHLEVIKLLMCLSQSPTTEFLTNPPELPVNKEESITDWGAYLKEGIEEWHPCVSDPGSDWSDDENEYYDALQITLKNKTLNNLHLKPDFLKSSDPYLQAKETKESLINNIQSHWWNKRERNAKPISPIVDANVAVIWNDYTEYITHGLVPKPYLKLVTEHKCIREIIWQMYTPHTSCLFCFKGNDFCVRTDVSIASVRVHPFREFLESFLPYINLTNYLNTFLENINNAVRNSSTTIPDTYINYGYAVRTICIPIYQKLREIEKNVLDQRDIYTLLTLANDIRRLFKPLHVLKNIHTTVLEDCEKESALICATTTLSKLYMGFTNSHSKCQQDIYLTLYLESIKTFLNIIDTWLTEDRLIDPKEEFIIYEQFNQPPEKQWEQGFVLKPLEGISDKDPLLRTIQECVLPNAKNIHLLRHLGNLKQLSDVTGPCSETIYEEFLRKILEEISKYFKIDENDMYLFKKKEFEDMSTSQNECKSLAVLDDKLTNFQCGKQFDNSNCDLSDMLLMKAFQWRLTEEFQEQTLNVNFTLYERISNLVQDFFPIQQLMTNTLKDIIKNRFSISCLLVKQVLMEKYKLNSHFQLLQHLYLFSDDLLSPIYRKMFHDIEFKNKWGNFFYMTSRLQDIFSDMYPDFYEKCRVEVDRQWKFCFDPIIACQMVNIDYNVQWPINIFIRAEHMEMYKELFHIILKLKWAIYTLNHLSFADIEAKSKKEPHYIKSRKYGTRLKLLRFWLVNDFSVIQHHLLGYLYNKYNNDFEKNIEQAYDVDTLINAHNIFITSMHENILNITNYNENSYGFLMLLKLVDKLSIMWNDLINVENDELKECEQASKECHKYLNPLVYIPKLYKT